jgi:hypothetical protein
MAKRERDGGAAEIERTQTIGYHEYLWTSGTRVRDGHMLDCTPITAAERASRRRAKRTRKRARRRQGEARKARLRKHGLTGPMIRHWWTPLHQNWDWHYRVARPNAAARALREASAQAQGEAPAKPAEVALSAAPPVPAAPPPAALPEPPQVILTMIPPPPDAPEAAHAYYRWEIEEGYRRALKFKHR